MRRERYYDDDEPYYQPRRPTTGNGPAWCMAALMLIGVVAFIGYILIDMYPKGVGETPAKSTAPVRQAPPSVVRRGSAPAQDAAPANPNVAGNEATATALYDAAVAGQQAPAPAPLPLNSAGQPIISAEQQQQQSLSLQLAEQEGNAAADQDLQQLRATAYADAASRAPDVSAADVRAMTGRNPCAVPRADPHTCDQGLFKPTPVQ